MSTKELKLEAQIRALQAAGCARIFHDLTSGKNADRPDLKACLDYVRAGDILVVTRLDRLARSLQDLITTVTVLRRRGTGFRALHEELDTTTPGGRLVFHVFAALAEFVRELIVEGTCDGLEAARARGVRLGRPPAMTAEQVRQARDLLARPDTTVSSIARLLNVSRSTIYKYVPELSGGSESALGRGGVEAPALAGRGGKAAPARHESRPGRLALVATSLADLRGPSEGTVELPLHLFWSSPDHEFDLGESYMELSLYETVLREASRLEDLARYLNAETLVRIWPELFLPKGVRRAWEKQHPALRAAGRAS